jgi:plasmid maintenance system antidote protein VapI
MPRGRKAVKTADDVLYELQRLADTYESDAALARAFGVSRAHMSRVLRGLKPITAAIAHGLGYEEQPRYVRYEHRD